jgi:hypothetical protein
MEVEHDEGAKQRLEFDFMAKATVSTLKEVDHRPTRINREPKNDQQMAMEFREQIDVFLGEQKPLSKLTNPM